MNPMERDSACVCGRIESVFQEKKRLVFVGNGSDGWDKKSITFEYLTTYSYDCLSLEQHRSLNLELCFEILLIYRNL